MNNPHDRFGRKFIHYTWIASDLLRHYADPVIAEYIDLDCLQTAPPQAISDELKEVIKDASFLTRLQDSSAKTEVLITVEHKSCPSPHVALQLGTQMFLSLYVLWTNAQYTNSATFHPPIPIMVVLYNGAEDWVETEIWFQELFKDIPPVLRDLVPQFRVIVINLKQFEYGNLPGRPETQAIVESMKRATDGTFFIGLDGILYRVRDAGLDKQVAWDLVGSIVTYCSWVTSVPEEQITKIIKQVFSGQEGVDMAEAFFKDTLEKGIEIGELKGEIKTILTFLRARFKQVPQHIVDSLNRRTDAIALESLVVLAATCSSLDEFAAEL